MKMILCHITTACETACVFKSVVAVGNFAQHFHGVLSGVAAPSTTQPIRGFDGIQLDS